MGTSRPLKPDEVTSELNAKFQENIYTLVRALPSHQGLDSYE